MTGLICIVCPASCRLTAEQTADGLRITGNSCNRGISFAQIELQNPTRTLTTTVRTIFADRPALPVRTDGEIPKTLLREAVRILADVVIDCPVKRGEAVVANLLNTGCSVIATETLERGDEIYVTSV